MNLFNDEPRSKSIRLKKGGFREEFMYITDELHELVTHLYIYCSAFVLQYKKRQN